MRIFPDDRLHFALIIPCFFGALDRDAAGNRSTYDGALHLMLRRGGYLHIAGSLYNRRLSGLCLGQGVCIHHADRCAGCTDAGAGIGGDIGDRELVVRLDSDRLCIHYRAAAHHGQRPFLAHIRRVALKFGGHLALDVRQSATIIGREGFISLGFVDFLAGPAIYMALISVFIGGTGEKRLVAIALGRAEVIDGNTAGEADSAHRRCDRVGGNIFHVILRSDGESAIGVEGVVVSEVRIGLGLHGRHVHGGAQCPGTHSCAAHGTAHLIDGVVRFHRDGPALPVCPVEIDRITGIRLGDGGEIHHIHRAGETCIKAAGALDGEIDQVFCILCQKRCLSGGLQSSGASHESFGILLDIGDAYSCPGSGAAGSDGKAAITAFELGGIRSGDGNAFSGSGCLIRADLTAFGNIGFRRRVQHVHADGAIDGYRTGAGTAHRGIGQVSSMRCRYGYLRTTVDSRPFIGVGIGASLEGNGGIIQADAHIAATGHGAGLSKLGQGGVRRNGCATSGCHGSALSYTGIGGMSHECLRRSACHAGSAADAKAIGQGLRVTGICRFDRERVHAILATSAGSDLDAVPYKSSGHLIHHFYRRREPAAGGAADRAGSRRSIERGGIFCRNGYILRGFYRGSAAGSAAALFLILNLFFANEGFRVGGDVMSTGCPGTGKFAASCQSRRYRSKLLRGNGLHIHGARCFESHFICDRAIGVALIFLYIHSRTDTVAGGESYTTGQAKELRRALGVDSDITIGNIIGPFAQIGIGGLRNHIHRHRAASCKLGRATGRTHCHGLRRGVAIFIAGRSVVRIVGGNGESARLRCLGLRVGRDGRVIYHDGDRRTCRFISYSHIAYTQSSAAVIRSVYRESIHFHFFIIHVGIGFCVNPISCAREAGCHISGRRSGGYDGLDATIFLCIDRGLPAKSAAGPGDSTSLHISFGATLDEVHGDGSPDRRTLATGKGNGSGVGIDLSFIRGAYLHRLVSLHRAVLHVSSGGISHPVQRNLPGPGAAISGAAAAGCDI